METIYGIFQKKGEGGGGGGDHLQLSFFSTKKVVVLVPKHTVHPFLVYFEKKSKKKVSL